MPVGKKVLWFIFELLMAVLFHCFLLQTDFEKDVDIACRSGKNIKRVFSQQNSLVQVPCEVETRKILGFSCL